MDIEKRIIELLLLGMFREQEKRENLLGKIGVTTLTFPCARSGYYALTVPEQYRSISIYGLMKMWQGTMLHKTSILQGSMEMTLIGEGELDGIVGHCDEYLKEEAYVLEKKSTSTIPRDEPRPHHVQQIEYYRCLLESLGYPCARGSILYINPTTCKAKNFPVKFERSFDEVKKEMIAKKNYIFNAVKYGIPPPRNAVPWEDEGLSIVCEYCSYIHICFREP